MATIALRIDKGRLWQEERPWNCLKSCLISNKRNREKAIARQFLIRNAGNVEVEFLSLTGVKPVSGWSRRNVVQIAD
jgi:hypothetical protein